MAAAAGDAEDGVESGAPASEAKGGDGAVVGFDAVDVPAHAAVLLRSLTREFGGDAELVGDAFGFRDAGDGEFYAGGVGGDKGIAYREELQRAADALGQGFEHGAAVGLVGEESGVWELGPVGVGLYDRAGTGRGPGFDPRGDLTVCLLVENSGETGEVIGERTGLVAVGTSGARRAIATEETRDDRVLRRGVGDLAGDAEGEQFAADGRELPHAGLRTHILVPYKVDRSAGAASRPAAAPRSIDAIASSMLLPRSPVYPSIMEGIGKSGPAVSRAAR